ncbi:MAG: hypothetical protein Q4G33_13650, partial [bacterium]|nr:hypothetical protein [bacterium]
MNKNYRKTVSFLAALSMVSASVVLPSSVLADGSGIVVDGTTASVTTDKAGVAIVASYDENGRLTAAKLQEAAVGTTTVEVKTGDKVMLWDGIGADANKPMTASVEVAAPIATTEPSSSPEVTSSPEV